MCLYPIRIKNKKYQENKKNGGVIPALPIKNWNPKHDNVALEDTRILWVEVPCGQCIECRKSKARDWQVRLLEEIKETRYNYFITLTFDPIQLGKLKGQTHLSECNAICAVAVRRSLERFRKDKKHSLKHWLVTELGHEGTKRIHMHGLLLSDEPLVFEGTKEDHMFKWKYWKYGHVYVGDYVNAKTVNYIVKYITKIDTENKGFVGQVLCSPGIGKSWLEKASEMKLYKATNGKILDTYVTANGAKIKLPKYYKNKLYNEKEREENWRSFLDLQQETIMGNTYSTKTTSEETLKNITNKAKEVNDFLEYGDNSKEWQKKPYNVTQQMLRKKAKEETLKVLEREARRKKMAKLREMGIKV